MPMKPGIDSTELSAAISPKHDLFRHVNGSWLDANEIPEDKAVFGSFHMLADDAELAVKEILEEAAANPRPGVSQQIGDLYSSFLDEDRVEAVGMGRLSEGLEKIQEITSFSEFFAMVGALERAGVGGLWGSYVDNDPGNPERYLVHLYQGGLGLPDKDYYTDDKYKEIREEYVPHISRMLMLSGREASDSIEIARGIFELESKIAKLHWSKVESRDAEKTYNLRDFATLRSMNKTLTGRATLLVRR
jgi:Predicted metalloendopeptidase